MRRVALAALIVLGLAACGGTKTVTVTRAVTTTKTVTVTTTQSTATPAACLASSLSGTFAPVPGSAGAGQISYRLRLTNQGDATCFVSGIPGLQLLDRQGADLPTNVSAAQPGTGTAVRVDLQPGDAATTEARFSPDVPDQTEQTVGACEPKAVMLRVTIGAGTLDAPIVPPTSVCERGSLRMSNLTAAQ